MCFGSWVPVPRADQKFQLHKVPEPPGSKQASMRAKLQAEPAVAAPLEAQPKTPESSAQAPVNKPEFYDRYLKGQFGNRPRVWTSLDALKESGYEGTVSIRSMTPGGTCKVRVPVADLKSGEYRVDAAHNAVFQESLPGTPPPFSCFWSQQ